MSDNQKKLLSIILEVFIDTKSDELKYVSEWLFDWPSQSLELGGISLHKKYKLPEYNKKDLSELEKNGYLLKESETEEDPITLYKEVLYRVIPFRSIKPTPATSS